MNERVDTKVSITLEVINKRTGEVKSRETVTSDKLAVDKEISPREVKSIGGR